MYTEKELIDFCKKGAEDEIKYRLHMMQNRHLISDFSEYIPSKTRVRFETDEFKWGESKITETKERLPINHYAELYTSGILKFTNIATNETTEVSHAFSIFISYSYNKENDNLSFEILNQEQNILRCYNEQIFNRVKKLDLLSLLNENSIFDNKGSVEFFTTIIRNENNQPAKYDLFEKHDDLIMCHQDIMLSIAELDIYKPYISNLTMHPVNSGDKTIYQYFPNFYDKNYLSTCGKVIELLYNYWDKIGAILSPYLTPEIPLNRVFFGKVIDKIDIEVSNEYIHWLREFKHNQYVDLNERRKKIVHYTSLESQTFRGYYENFSDFDKLTAIQLEKENLPNYFISQFEFATKGFYNAVKLLATR
jgi:hypothetical protein